MRVMLQRHAADSAKHRTFSHQPHYSTQLMHATHDPQSPAAKSHLGGKIRKTSVQPDFWEPTSLQTESPAPLGVTSRLLALASTCYSWLTPP